MQGSYRQFGAAAAASAAVWTKGAPSKGEGRLCAKGAFADVASGRLRRLWVGGDVGHAVGERGWRGVGVRVRGLPGLLAADAGDASDGDEVGLDTGIHASTPRLYMVRSVLGGTAFGHLHGTTEQPVKDELAQRLRAALRALECLWTGTSVLIEVSLLVRDALA